MPASVAQPPCSPFARPGSRAGSNTGLTDNIQGSPISSVNSELFPRDNTSASVDLIDADLDAEVAGLAGQRKQPQTPLPPMSGVKTNSQVLFQPIFTPYATPAQHQDQALYNSSLNLIDDLPRPQTLGSTAHRPQQPAPHVKMPPTPYVNQATVSQHMNGQSAQPRGVPAGMGNPPQQQHPSVGTPPCPPNAQPAPLPSFQNSPVDTRTKSKNGQGIKKSKSSPPSADKDNTILRKLVWHDNSEVITDHNRDCIFRNCKRCGAINTLQESIIKQNPDIDWAKQVTWHQWQYVLLDNGENKTKKKRVIDKIRYRGPLAQLLNKFIQSLNAISTHLFHFHWQAMRFDECKKQLREGDVMLVMDFSTNYSHHRQGEFMEDFGAESKQPYILL